MTHRTLRIVFLASAALLAGGCTATPEGPRDGAAETAGAPTVPPRPPAVAWDGEPRELPIIDGTSGEPMSWTELIARVSAVDAVIIGELHDDAVGHAFQAAITGDAITAVGGGAAALEMLERDEQTVVDDWMDGIIDAERLAIRTESASWAGENSWLNWYQPILDAARASGGRVVAANAPRRYVRMARSDGFDRIAGLPAPRRGFVEIPSADVDDDAYFGRFVDIMSGHMTQDGAGPDDATIARLRNTFRSQRTWDATMGDSVARALGRGAPVVLLMVGQFHSDFEGATVLELRARRPGVRVLTISMQKRTGMAMDPEDVGRADIIVHTGVDS